MSASSRYVLETAEGRWATYDLKTGPQLTDNPSLAYSYPDASQAIQERHKYEDVFHCALYVREQAPGWTEAHRVIPSTPTILESLRQPLPASLYNCSPEECTPKSTQEDYLKSWCERTEFTGTYPVNVIAQEMEFVSTGPCTSKGRKGRILDTLGPCNDIGAAREALLALFYKHRETRGRVFLYPQSMTKPATETSTCYVVQTRNPRGWGDLQVFHGDEAREHAINLAKKNAPLTRAVCRHITDTLL